MDRFSQNGPPLPPEVRISRRRFLGLSAATVAAATLAGGATALLLNEATRVVIERVSAPVPGLQTALEGVTIAQLSDIHLSPLVPTAYVRRVVEITNSLRPDITVLTGDYVWRDVEAVFELATIIGGLDARYGVFAALGNHDIWTNVNVISQGLREARLPLLRNRGVSLDIDGTPLYLAGLDDGWSGEPDLSAALAGAAEDTPVVLLLHEPDLAVNHGHTGRISLQLSGHSHGGQVRSSRDQAYVLPYLGRQYDKGLYRVGNMWLYTNRGIGVTRYPVRFNCPPEITLLTLYAA